MIERHLTLFTFLFCAFYILFMVTIVYFANKMTCETRSKMMGIESDYGLFTNCMVKIDGKWQPFNEYNTVNLNTK